MPLRDHFRMPIMKFASWEGFHAMLPSEIVRHLKTKLPKRYVSEPRVHLGSYYEIDIGAFDQDDSIASLTNYGDSNSGVATLPWVAPTPTLVLDTELPNYDEYEVLIFDVVKERELVAAIEIVSPRNKDRPQARNDFVAKCAALLQKGIAVSIIDLVTIRKSNLYAELMQFIGQSDPTLGDQPPETYAVSCRWLQADRKGKLETWTYPLKITQKLPTLPIWLTPTLSIPLDLEPCYENACSDLSIPWIPE